MKITKRTQTGFTLLEMILVLVIMASVLGLITNYSSQRLNQFRRDRTAAQMQQILNAALSYYTSVGKWPLSACGTPMTLSGSPLSLLQTQGYLPNQPIRSPWAGLPYLIGCTDATGIFTVTAAVPTMAEAVIMTGELPMVAISGTGSPYYYVTAQVNIPGQNLNNARSMNFGSLYHSGACVPVPTCPSGMSPQILVVPGSVNGVNNAPTQSDGVTTSCTSTVYNSAGAPIAPAGTCAKINVYPITNFSAFATGGANGATIGGAINGPPSCNGAEAAPNGGFCYNTITVGGNSNANKITSGAYWRVCLSVQTENGVVTIPSAAPAQNSPNLFWTESLGYVYATTRCTPTGGEPSGSDFNGYYY